MGEVRIYTRDIEWWSLTVIDASGTPTHWGYNGVIQEITDGRELAFLQSALTYHKPPDMLCMEWQHGADPEALEAFLLLPWAAAGLTGAKLRAQERRLQAADTRLEAAHRLQEIHWQRQRAIQQRREQRYEEMEYRRRLQPVGRIGWEYRRCEEESIGRDTDHLAFVNEPTMMAWYAIGAER